MEENMYSIELLHQGKYESWDFKDEKTRDEMFEKVKKEFADRRIDEKNEDVDDSKIVQLSATNLKIKDDGVSQTVPYEWYRSSAFNDILVSLNHRYEDLE
ncbi:hypothetical protein [Planococcus salinus]|uniref:Uncharacterized protein n=1 Tax=Planococcus salinus TaxID=1848460 RepID=A0A3M8P9U4_9BACL|nr:hypothetical protein [Planococcus salinus]RNF40447.1 hypothetical protein EEX84_03205 [Planococcus salinus]